MFSNTPDLARELKMGSVHRVVRHSTRHERIFRGSAVVGNFYRGQNCGSRECLVSLLK